MTDYNELKKPIDAQWLKRELASVNAKLFPSNAHIAMEQALEYIEQQEQRVAELEAKATRYQLMRDTDWQDLEVIRLYAGPDFDQLMGDDLDAQLDSVIAKSSKDQQDNGTEGV